MRITQGRHFGQLNLNFIRPIIGLSLLRHLVVFQVVLWWNSECIRNTIEKGKHRRDVNGFCNLRLGPAQVAQPLHVFVSGAIGSFRHLADVLQQPALRIAQPRAREISVRQRLYRFFLCSLNTQEVCMRVQSVGTAIQIRHPARDRFLGAPRQMAFGEVNRVAEP